MLWKGLSGAKCCGVMNRLRRLLYKHKYPTILILHLGTNNLFRETIGETRDNVEENLTGIRALLPHTKIIWSDILPRLFYKNEDEPGTGKTNTININNHAHQIIRDDVENAHYIKHSNVFNPKHTEMFNRKDGIHLSAYGNRCLRHTLTNAIRFFDANPSRYCYPPELDGTDYSDH